MSEKQGDVIIDGDKATIIFRRTLHHSIDKVWEAITNPDDLSQWMLGSATIDPRVGGNVEYVSAPTPIVWYGKILQWNPPHLYEYEFNTDADPRWSAHLGDERTIARWELQSLGGETRLTLTFTNFTRSTARGFSPGTQAFLERLDAYLAGDPLPDWERRFMELMPLYATD